MSDIDDILNGVRTIKVAGQDVVLDPSRLVFNEASLSKYQEQEAVWYDYFGQRLADSEAEWHFFETKLDELKGQKFADFKESGGSDKLVEAKVDSDPDVVTAIKAVNQAKHKMKILVQHLRAWDKNHDNAQSRGHMLRKEMDKLHHTMGGADDITDQVDDIVRRIES